MMSFGCDADVL